MSTCAHCAGAGEVPTPPLITDAETLAIIGEGLLPIVRAWAQTGTALAPMVEHFYRSLAAAEAAARAGSE
jgi:hypothetical protein